MAKKGKKIPREQAENIVINVCQDLVGYHRIKVCGSIRRKKKVVGDVDFVVSPVTEDPAHIIKSIREDIGVTEIITKGPKIHRVMIEDVQIDFYLCPDRLFESYVLFLTGSKWFNIKCRTLAKEVGYRLSQYGLLTADGEEVAITENDILETLGLEHYMNPVSR
jgi:DNA polymerase (family X)